MPKRMTPVRMKRVTKPKPDAGPGLPIMTVGDYYARVIGAAVEFTATRHLGRGRKDTRRSKTLEGARAHARDIGIDRALVYAIDNRGRSVPIEAGGKLVIP